MNVLIKSPCVCMGMYKVIKYNEIPWYVGIYHTSLPYSSNMHKILNTLYDARCIILQKPWEFVTRCVSKMTFGGTDTYDSVPGRRWSDIKCFRLPILRSRYDWIESRQQRETKKLGRTAPVVHLPRSEWQLTAGYTHMCARMLCCVNVNYRVCFTTLWTISNKDFPEIA